ncbi:hypothetical protein [Streptomyces beigongshangae]|uniref:hypothetical protein n=1 Tax=Streptomyces beigongshangae TaxID=2841597 RepID=UPI001C85783A|nr:hypothetical protein [Streptomyces sp. REN17]
MSTHAAADTGSGAASAPTTPGVLATHAVETSDGRPGGRLEFRTEGDVVTVSDQQANDGHAAQGYVYEYISPTLRGDRVYTLRDNGSDGVPKIARESDGGSHNLKEDQMYWFRICLVGPEDGLSGCVWKAWGNVG